MGFLKKLKETAEKSIEKGVELGTKGYDVAKESAKKGIDNARNESINNGGQSSNDETISITQSNDEVISRTVTQSNEVKENPKKIETNIDPEALQILKMRLVKGEITKEEFEEMKGMLSETNPLVSTNTFKSSAVLPNSGKTDTDWIENLPLMKEKKYEKALEDFESKLATNSNDVKSWMGKGRVLRELNRFEDAIDAYDMALKIDENNAYSWRGKGLAHNSLGRRREALEALDNALTIDPNFISCLEGKANILHNNDKFNESLEHAQQIIRLDPESLDGWAWCGWNLDKLGRKNEATNSFETLLRLSEKAIAKDKNDSNAWYYKSKALYNINKQKEGKKAFEQYEKLIKK